VLNVPVSEVILNEPRVRALVGQSEAASVAQHVRMGEDGHGSGGTVCPQKKIDRRTVQRLTLLADKKCSDGGGRFHPLFGMTPEDFQQQDVRIIASIVGVDTVIVAPVQNFGDYNYDQIEWNRRFVEIYDQNEEGQWTVDYARIDETEDIAPIQNLAKDQEEQAVGPKHDIERSAPTNKARSWASGVVSQAKPSNARGGVKVLREFRVSLA